MEASDKKNLTERGHFFMTQIAVATSYRMLLGHELLKCSAFSVCECKAQGGSGECWVSDWRQIEQGAGRQGRAIKAAMRGTALHLRSRQPCPTQSTTGRTEEILCRCPRL